MKNAIIKLKSRGYLIGNLLVLSLVLLIFLVFSLCLGILPEITTQLLADISERVRSLYVIIISFVILVVFFCTFSIFSMGFCRYFLRKAERKGGKAGDLFFYFSPSESFSVLCFYMRYMTMKAILFALCFLPFTLCGVFLGWLIEKNVSLGVSFVLFFTDLILLILGAVVFSNFKNSLFLVKYYYAKGTYLNFRQLVSSSQSEMKRNGTSLLKLQVSFWGWFLSCLTILPSVYVFMYYHQSMAVLAAEIMEE